jgi:prepilin-type N-terminal cleavage/methylation domain-containing protein
MFKNKGFTIIELLVVISIISFLASIVLVNVNMYMSKARDARTKADIRQIIIAMQMYYADHGSYPTTNGNWACLKSSGSCWNGSYSGSATLISDLATYISNIPKAQANSGCYAYDTYLYNSSWGSPASIIWKKETPFVTGECDGYYAGSYDCGYYYCYQYIES